MSEGRLAPGTMVEIDGGYLESIALKAVALVDLRTSGL